MLLRVVCDALASAVEKADSFVIDLVGGAQKLVIAPILDGRNHIGLTATSVGRDVDRLITWVDIVAVRGFKNTQHILLEIDVRVRGVRMRGLERRLLVIRQFIEIVTEAVVELDNNIYVALAVDVRVVAVRALQKNRVVLPRVG